MDPLTKTCPPYAGNEPYLHLCFSERSAKKVSALLRCLYERGVRVWYCSGNSADRKEREETERRMLGARLTAVYLDDAFRNDAAAKSRLLTCQRNGQRILCLNTDGGDSGLSIGLHADAQEAVLDRGASAGDAENALLHAEGFSQELIGEPVKVRNHRFRAVIGILIALTLITVAAGVLWIRNHPSTEQKETTAETDAVQFTDENVREAVRDAIGGGILKEEKIRGITLLRLPGDVLPDDLSDLALLPSLETLEISQAAAKGIYDRPELAPYRIELFGGDSE